MIIKKMLFLALPWCCTTSYFGSYKKSADRTDLGLLRKVEFIVPTRVTRAVGRMITNV
jgi:hypothetical protein